MPNFDAYVTLIMTVTPVDLSHVPRRLVTDRPPPSSVEEEEEEMVWEAVPLMLQHIDLSAYLLKYSRWAKLMEWTADYENSLDQYQWTDEEVAELMAARGLAKRLSTPVLTTVTIWLGMVESSIVYPVSPETPICYDCARPLDLFTLSRRDPDLPRGYCPGCMMLLYWRREWRESMPQSPEAYLFGKQEEFLSEWRKQDLLRWRLRQEPSTSTSLSNKPS